MTSQTHRPHAGHSTARTKPSRSSSSTARDKHQSHCLTEQSDEDFVREYFTSLPERYQRPKLGLQHQHLNEPASSILRHSGIYRHPALTPGQKLYLLEKCHVYDNEATRKHRTNSCLQTLSRRFNEDLLHKPEFRLNDPRDIYNYTQFLNTPRSVPRPLNTGYNTPRNPRSSRSRSASRQSQQSARMLNDLDRLEFAVLFNSPLD